jgi:hypothetical protein
MVTADMLKQAFDITVEIHRAAHGKAYLSYENNF